MDRTIGGWARFAINVAASFIFIVGAIFHVDQMFLMALALALLPGASWIVGRVYLGGIVCSRTVPTLCGVGEVVPVVITLTNTARLARPALRVFDIVPRGLKPIDAAAKVVLNLRPGSTGQIRYQIQAERRGRYQLSSIRLDSADPMGFFLFSQRCPAVSDVAVYPELLPLRRVFWEDTVVAVGEQEELAQRRGPGLEFHGVREYQPGDELRHVHWRTTARTGRLAVTEYAHGTSHATVVALDLDRTAYGQLGDGREEGLECAVKIAASICAYLIRSGRPVRLLTAADLQDDSPPRTGTMALAAILETLVSVEATAETSLLEVVRQAPVLKSAARTLVCITPARQAETYHSGRTGADANPAFGVQVLSVAGKAARPTSALWRGVAPGDDVTKILEGS